MKAWKPPIRESCFNISVNTPKTRARLDPSLSSRFSSRTLSRVLKFSKILLMLPLLTILMMEVMACLLSEAGPPVLTVCRVVTRSLT